jgi:hypothetical protein
MRRSMRWKINKLIMIQVSGIIKVPLLYSLVTEAELIHVTSMTTKHVNKCFLSWIGGFFPYLSFVVERWLWIGWVVSLVDLSVSSSLWWLVLEINLGALFSPLSSHLSKLAPNLYVNLVALSSTRFKSYSIIFSLTTVLSR